LTNDVVAASLKCLVQASYDYKILYIILTFTGCTIFPEDDARSRILTVNPDEAIIYPLTSNKPQCTPEYQNFLIWRNGTWESYNYTGIVSAAYKGKPDATGEIVQQLSLVVNISFYIN